MKDYESFYNKFNLFAERVEASVMQIRKVLFFERVCYSSVFVSFFFCPVFAKLFFSLNFSRRRRSCRIRAFWDVYGL